MNSKLSPDTTRIFRHLVATIAFRASRSLRGATPDFENVRLSEDGMTARDLLLHMTNVLSFAIATLTAAERVRYEALLWDREVERFYALLTSVDAQLVSGVEIANGMDLTLLQGPFADVLTHIGQLHAMRRKANAPVVPVSYIKADIRIGRIALQEQPE
jgi:hypothetical protein